MKRFTPALLLFLLLNAYYTCAQTVPNESGNFAVDTIAQNLGFPWEITLGPDDSLWVTEARGYRVLRMSRNRNKNAAPQQVLKINLNQGEINFRRGSGAFVAAAPETYSRWPQGGMMGLAIHPQFYSGKPWVYLAYVYKQVSCPNSNTPCYYRTKIVRCRFYFAADGANPSSLPKKDTLVINDTLLSNLPGSNDHNSGRMTISPQTETDGTYKLYYTIGDMGAGQFNNASRTNHAQNKDTCEGKILRLNTEPDADGDPASPTHDYERWRKWIPNDNPFTQSVNGFRTPVYSYGHRNAQGLSWGNTGSGWKLYSSEHGDKSDDEVNIIEAGKNYGWPKVAGLCDNNYNTTDAFTKNNQLAGQNVSNEIAAFCNVTADNKEPMFSFFNHTGSQIEGINLSDIFTWPTIAPSSTHFYSSANVTGWQHSLLVTSLKYGMFRLKLKSSGTGVDSTVSLAAVDTFPLFHGWRIRDIAVSSSGAAIYAAVDSSGSTSGPTGGFSGGSVGTPSAGRILRFINKFSTLALKEDNNPFSVRNSHWLRVYPNPATNFLVVENKKNLPRPFTYMLYSITGQLIKTGTAGNNRFSVNVSDVKTGIYIFRLYSGIDAEVLTERLIIQ
jgi:aldose sugar dehydrogenase